MLPPHGWQYQRMDKSRSELLMRVASLDQLVAEILAGGIIEEIRLKELCDEAKREGRIAHRVTFSLRPINEAACVAADRLLNGAFGLRAHYCCSPEEGSNATSVVCRSLSDAVLTRSAGSSCQISGEQLHPLADALGESLLKSSAKVWFDPPTDKRPGRFEDGEVFSDVWARSRVDRKECKRRCRNCRPSR